MPTVLTLYFYNFDSLEMFHTPCSARTIIHLDLLKKKPKKKKKNTCKVPVIWEE